MKYHFWTLVLVLLLAACTQSPKNAEMPNTDSLEQVRQEDSLAQINTAQEESPTRALLDASQPKIAQMAEGTLKELMIKAQLNEVLQEQGPFTVFVPTAECLLTSQNELKKLSKEAEKLKARLSKHIIKGLYTIPDLKDGQELESINGDKIKVQINGGTIRVAGAEIVEMDIMAGNGVIHQINKMLE